MAAEIEDTYAEGFKSLFAQVLVTARDRYWLERAVAAATGNASSTILCDCEAGLSHLVGPGTPFPQDSPDGRPGAVLQFHLPKFRKDRQQALERSLLVRLSQNVLTCPTARCFNALQSDKTFRLGRKIAFFGDGHQFRTVRFNRNVWVIPILGGEFEIETRFGFQDGIMGGNLWFMGRTVDAALDAAMRAAAAAGTVPGVILPFPGGIAASGSKTGSRYSFSIASTYEKFCPTLRAKLGEQSSLPPDVQSVMEIIVNGHSMAAVDQALQSAIAAAKDTPGLLKISAGNYGGRLGKTFFYLRPKTEEAAESAAR